MQLTNSRNRCFALFVVLLVGFVAAGGCRPTNLPDGASRDLADIDHLLQLMERRLALMDQVARSKWDSDQPIADPQREREMLEKVVERGRGKGLDPDLVRRFFAAQIEAARIIQQADFEHWLAVKHKPFGNTTSLGELRQQIDSSNDELIEALAAIAERVSTAPMQESLRQRAEAILSSEKLAPVRATVIGPLIR
jgi:chorismate mutase